MEVDELIKGQLHSESQLSGEIKELDDGHKERSDVINRLKKQEESLLAKQASLQSSAGNADGVKRVDEEIKTVQSNVLSLQKHLYIVRDWINVLSKSKTNVSEDIKRLVSQYEGLMNSKGLWEKREEELNETVSDKQSELENMKKAREETRKVQ